MRRVLTLEREQVYALVVARDAARQAVASAEFKATMQKLVTPIDYRDAPEFKKFWDNDAARLKVALEKIGKVDKK